jgi:2-polyprenyl-3-methyl-5-hydroxy-6-metoxy-1,4-benzoquinol methylase
MSSRTAYEFAHCIVCGHTDADVLAEAEDLRREVEWLWEYQSRRLKPDTPSRRLMDRVAFSQDRPLRLVRCRDCGLVYRNPVERVRELDSIYGDDGGGPARDTMVALHATQRVAYRAQARRLRDALRGKRGGRVLEVGSYVGAFLDAARGEGLVAEGVDINAATNGFTRSLGFTVHDGELADMPCDQVFDAVAIWNTFDQLADPRATVRAAAERLSAVGVLALRVPNGACYVEWRERLRSTKRATRAVARAVLAQNNLLTFPYRWGFTLPSLVRFLRAAGLTVQHVYGDVLVPTADEWTRPWARIEERAAKAALRLLVARAPERAPWIEVYARQSASRHP